MFDNVFGKSEYGWRKAVVCKLFFFSLCFHSSSDGLRVFSAI
jgi:hypothetical protein